VVALWVGMALGGERHTGWVFAAMPLILAALGLILYGGELAKWLTRWRGVQTQPSCSAFKPDSSM
jgi:hypothetical protein